MRTREAVVVLVTVLILAGGLGVLLGRSLEAQEVTLSEAAEAEAVRLSTGRAPSWELVDPEIHLPGLEAIYIPGDPIDTPTGRGVVYVWRVCGEAVITENTADRAFGAYATGKLEMMPPSAQLLIAGPYDAARVIERDPARPWRKQ